MRATIRSSKSFPSLGSRQYLRAPLPRPGPPGLQGTAPIMQEESRFKTIYKMDSPCFQNQSISIWSRGNSTRSFSSRSPSPSLSSTCQVELCSKHFKAICFFSPSVLTQSPSLGTSSSSALSQGQGDEKGHQLASPQSSPGLFSETPNCGQGASESDWVGSGD